VSKTKLDLDFEKKVLKAMKLLQKMDKLSSGDGGAVEKMVIGGQIKSLSRDVRSAAEARLRGDKRPGLMASGAKPRDEEAIASEWAKVLAEHKDLKAKWNQAAIDSEILFQVSLIEFGTNMDPLIEALEQAKVSAVPAAKTLASRALNILVPARESLQPLSEAAGRAVEELTQFVQLVQLLEGDPPQTMDEVIGARASFAEAIQAVRKSEVEIRRQCQAINEKAESSKDTIESTIKAMVVAAIAWRQSEDTREGTEWLDAILNGAVGLVQLGAGEPISSTGVQGLHMLIKGICDAIKGLAALIEGWKLNKREVLDLLDDLEADDFIQQKLDLIKIGLSWAAEPLGFIPSVGTVIRAAINGGVSLAIGILKEAAKKQKEDKEAKVTSEIEQIQDVIKDSVLSTVKVGIESAAETAKDWKDYVSGAKEPVELVINAVVAILGAPLKKILVDVVPAFELADKEQIKASISGARASVQKMADELATMKSINIDYAYDEDDAKDKTVATLANLKELGATSQALVFSSTQVGSRGVGLLVGSAHSDGNFQFARSMVEGGRGYNGLVTVTKAGSGMFAATITFTFPDAEAEELVKDYMNHHGKAKITKHSVKYAVG
jgi:hypothetical protein